MDVERPCVSIITVVRNARNSLEKALESVFSQSYDNLEVIVIDGGSSDGSVDIIRKYDDKIHYWCSEPDRGISHAFNKGIAACSGKFITFVHADDWLSNRQIECAVRALQKYKADIVFGDLNIYDAAGMPLYKRSERQHFDKINKKTFSQFSHMTVVFSRLVSDTIGPFDETYSLAMDYDWKWRAFNAGFLIQYDPAIVGNMKQGGASLKNYLGSLMEGYHIEVKHGHPRRTAVISLVKSLIKYYTLQCIQIVVPEKFVIKAMSTYKPHWSPIETK